MARITNIRLNSATHLNNLLELGRDYCSDHLGRFFQNNYSPPARTLNKFDIPTRFATRNEQDCFAICVMMNNHIVDLKYLNDIFPEWDNSMAIKSLSSGRGLDNFNTFIDDQRLLSVVNSFKKINEEIVIGRCRGNEFTPLQ